MPGMSSGLSVTNAAIVSAFRSALLHQALVVVVILAVLAVSWNMLRARQLVAGATGSGGASAGPDAGTAATPEPWARHLLRICFGLLWVFDGILQAQTSMPLGMTTQVIQPTATLSPSWVQHLVNAGVTIWSDHPIAAASSAVWIQIGIGLLLLVAPRGAWSRLGGVASVFWGLLVWVFGEVFGGIFAPGLSWLFGGPGAVLVYVIAGLLVALPEHAYESRRLGRSVLRGIGIFLVGMAVLQAWPGRGFWTGRVVTGHGTTLGTIVTMTKQMAATPQPHWLSSTVAAFSSLAGSQPVLVNALAVALPAVAGLAMLLGRGRLLRMGVVVLVVGGLADWLLVQDLGFLGGTGTDPNSMLPLIVLAVSGYVAVSRVPVPVPVPEILPARLVAGLVAGTPAAAPDGDSGDQGAARGLPGLRRWWSGLEPTYAFRVLAACGAVGVTLLGAAPMAVASTSTTADPILAESLGGTPVVEHAPASSFALTDQHGHIVSTTSLRGRTVLLTFLDPVCTTDCPLIAQELRQADGLLGASASRVEIVAIDLNPIDRAPAYLDAFDAEQDLTHLANWHFLTGSVAALSRTWSDYGIQVQVGPGGSMIAHSDLAYVIDPGGYVRRVVDTNPGPGTQATKSSFAGLLSQQVREVLASS